MPRDLVAIKVRIGLKTEIITGPSGTTTRRIVHDYPNFNALPAVQASGVDWSFYVDKEGMGWHYDKCCGHQVATLESPLGIQMGMLLVPKVFADQAVATFPLLVVKLTAAECQSFFDDHAHRHEPLHRYDTDVLQAIRLKLQRGIPLDAADQDALNPDSPTPGITKNPRRFWVDYQRLHGVNIIM